VLRKNVAAPLQLHPQNYARDAGKTRKANETEPVIGSIARRDSGSNSQRCGGTVAPDENERVAPVIVVRRAPKPAAYVPEAADRNG
jgi:hypothetical protein